jgi:hypothetical protein
MCGLVASQGAGGFSLWQELQPVSLALSRSSAAVPNASKDQSDSTPGGKKDQEWRREHEPGDHRGAGRQTATEIAIKGTRPGALDELMVNHCQLLKRRVTTSQRTCAVG